MKQLVQLHAGYRPGVLCTSLIQQWNGRNVSKAKPTTLGWSSSTVLDRNTQALHSGKLTIVNMEHTSQKLLVKCQCKLVQAKNMINFQNERKWLWFFFPREYAYPNQWLQSHSWLTFPRYIFLPWSYFTETVYAVPYFSAVVSKNIWKVTIFSMLQSSTVLTIQKQREPKQTTIFIYLGRTDNHEGLF